MKIAFIGHPLAGGSYSNFCYLRDNMKEVKFFLIGINDVDYKDTKDEKDYVFIANNPKTEKQKLDVSKSLILFLETQGIDILIPSNSPVAISILPFIKNVRIINIVNSDTNRVYKYVTEHLSYVSKVICISAKQYNKLVRLGSIIKKKLILIPHGTKIINSDIKKNVNNILVIGFIGRLHQGHKNILLLPKILSSLNIAFKFEIIGDGPDGEKLFEELRKSNLDFIYHGKIPHKKINEYLQDWDILLFPSVVEGFGLTLIEAMSNGVVPISNLLKGITDMIIENGKSGFLIKKNSVEQYAGIISALNADRFYLDDLKHNAKNKVEQEFNLNKVIEEYKKVFFEIGSSVEMREPASFDKWRPYKEYKPSIVERVVNRIGKLL